MTTGPLRALADAVKAAAFAILAGCSLLAPSDDELLGGESPGGAQPMDASSTGHDDGLSAGDGAGAATVDEVGDTLGERADVSIEARSEDGPMDGTSSRNDAGVRPADATIADARVVDADARIVDAAPRPEADAPITTCPAVADCSLALCEGKICGASSAQRCCSGACVDTASDARHCQGCGLACAAGQRCVLIIDTSGMRGHCTCDSTTECPHQPAQICRANNGDGQDGLCACDAVAFGNDGCDPGQVCADVPAANFCHY